LPAGRAASRFGKIHLPNDAMHLAKYVRLDAAMKHTVGLENTPAQPTR